jgi:hypothetical protein
MEGAELFDPAGVGERDPGFHPGLLRLDPSGGVGMAREEMSVGGTGWRSRQPERPGACVPERSGQNTPQIGQKNRVCSHLFAIVRGCSHLFGVLGIFLFLRWGERARGASWLRVEG